MAKLRIAVILLPLWAICSSPKKTATLKSLFFLLALCISWGTLSAQGISFAENFTDHAVLQRDIAHPIWGWAQPGAVVKLTFEAAVLETKADENGRWQVLLSAQKAGGPYVLTVAAGKQNQRISDVYFGDVYLLSGQSNMEWKLEQSDADGLRAASIADPLIREITVNRSFSATPDDHLDIGAPWRPGTEKNIRRFSAVGSYFAHYIRQEVDVPVGLLHSSWGGSRIEAWMSASTLGIAAGSSLKEEGLSAKAIQPALEKYRKDFGQPTPPTKDEGEQLGYLNPKTDYAKWPTIAVPGLWEEKGYANLNGHFYLARYFDVIAEQAAETSTLHLGPIDDSDWTYINGELVGELYASYAKPRDYVLKAGTLNPGKNVLLIRVEDTGGGGGLTAAPSEVKLSTKHGDVALAGDWHYQIGSFFIDQNRNQVPTILYNKMIHPLAGLPLAGILWYQGESNAAGQSAVDYAQQFKDMITDWRTHFGRQDLPFYWAQLANYLEPQAAPDEVGWATLRNSQTQALELPNTGQAVIIDIGEAGDIHPQNKWEVGRRLSLHALKNTYGKATLTASSPVIASAENMNNNRVTLKFDHVGTGLQVIGDHYGYVRGFVYRNQAGKWNWARTRISGQGNTINVVPNDGDEIKAIRYGWANNPDGNVFSSEGLPLTPFHLEVR